MPMRELLLMTRTLTCTKTKCPCFASCRIFVCTLDFPVVISPIRWIYGQLLRTLEIDFQRPSCTNLWMVLVSWDGDVDPSWRSTIATISPPSVSLISTHSFAASELLQESTTKGPAGTYIPYFVLCASWWSECHNQLWHSDDGQRQRQ